MYLCKASTKSLSISRVSFFCDIENATFRERENIAVYESCSPETVYNICVTMSSVWYTSYYIYTNPFLINYRLTQKLTKWTESVVTPVNTAEKNSSLTQCYYRTQRANTLAGDTFATIAGIRLRTSTISRSTYLYTTAKNRIRATFVIKHMLQMDHQWNISEYTPVNDRLVATIVQKAFFQRDG